MMNPSDERNFIQPMGSAIVLSGCLGLYSFQVLGLGLGSWRLEGRCLFSSCIWCGQWILDTGLSMGEDLYSFQPIGGPKVPCFYSF